MDDTKKFLETVVTTPTGYFVLMVGPPAHEEWFSWPDDIDRIVARAQEASGKTNVYFSPYLFKRPDSHKEFVLPSRTIAADLDHAPLVSIPLPPTVIVQTSPGRHQGYWVLRERDGVSLTEHEKLSRRMTYSIPDCDRSGWPLGHKFRLPGTLNYKYEQPPLIRVLDASASLRSYTPQEIREHTSEEPPGHAETVEHEWIAHVKEIKFDQGPHEMFERYRKIVGPKISQLMLKEATGAEGRSGGLWALTTALFRAGASRDEVYWIVKDTPNNKFAKSRYHAEEDLAKDIWRAEQLVAKAVKDVRTLIMSITKAPGVQAEKRQVIAKVVLDALERDGDFVVTEGTRPWYLRNDTGRPIPISRNDQMHTLLDARFNLNATDPVTNHVIARLQAFTLERGRPARTAVLSSYDSTINEVLLHSGRSGVYRITRDAMSLVPNGAQGALFLWRDGESTFYVNPEDVDQDPFPDSHWADFMFKDLLNNVIGLTREEAVAILRIWVLFIIVRDDAMARPILGFLGQPGSGKSTAVHLIYTLFYGPHKSIASVTTPDNFDSVTASDPVVIFDNVDSWQPWLPDRLALAASVSDIVKRKLYTDDDTVTMRRQAVLALTAHNPRFGREDVIDRMLILNFERVAHFMPERGMIDRVELNRNKLWHGIVRDLQKFLAEPPPDEYSLPQFRITDFSRVGMRIANALGLQEQFVEVIAKARAAQTSFNLAEADILVDTIDNWLGRQNGTAPRYHTTNQLWEYWSTMDPAFERQYKTANALGKKLFAIADSLRTIFDFEVDYDADRGVRTWKFGKKNQNHA